MALSSIGLVVHGGKQVARESAASLRRWAGERGVQVAEFDVWAAEGGRESARAQVEAAEPMDLVVTIGGDGTFLRGVAVAQVADVPVLGVDVGRVGFLTEVLPEQLLEALAVFEAGEAVLEERLTVTARASRPLEVPAELESLLRYGRGPMLPPPAVHHGDAEDVGWGVEVDLTALNDVVFEKLSRDRQASLGVYVGHRLFMSYSADAVVVSTPTGSTAYSFAAGGPVLSPRAQALVFTPVAPHMVFDRSFVVAADEVISVRVLERSGRVSMSVDGQIRGVLDPGDWVAVHARPWKVRLVRLKTPDFYGRVRQRLGLTDAAAAVADGRLPPLYLPRTPRPASMAHLHMPVVEPEGD
ncbi:NAD(+)/NADH kinase [Kineococcus sp. SYSU DK006]|uniref:NAD(+)/NADH kinase n=1 Tax=Kineococcus sp. SYSU DK006 TaxID=3383127 RepID=UPI003D7DD326